MLDWIEKPNSFPVFRRTEKPSNSSLSLRLPQGFGMFVPQVDQPCHDKQKIGEAVDQCLTHRVYGILIGIMQGNQDALDPSCDGAAVVTPGRIGMATWQDKLLQGREFGIDQETVDTLTVSNVARAFTVDPM